MKRSGGLLKGLGSLGAMAGVVEPCEGVGVDWLGEEGDSGALGERLVEMEELGEGRVLLDEDDLLWWPYSAARMV